MSLIKQAEKMVSSWGNDWDFWNLVYCVMNQEGGHVVIRPDFIGLAEEEGDTIKVWLAIGKDGVRKALELAPAHITKAAWMRRNRNSNDKPRTWNIFRIKRKIK